MERYIKNIFFYPQKVYIVAYILFGIKGFQIVTILCIWKIMFIKHWPQSSRIIFFYPAEGLIKFKIFFLLKLVWVFNTVPGKIKIH